VSDLWSTILGLSGQIEAWILDLTGSLWIYPGIYVLSVIDGFFPVVPSESVVIASATAWSQTGSPMLVGIWLAAALGAWCGDQVAYLIGAQFKVTRWRLFKTDKGKALLGWADDMLERRGSSFIIAARFIPMGRVIANMSAGALRYPHSHFMKMDAVGAAIWATYTVLLGMSAGQIFQDNLLVSIVVGVAAGILMGFVIDRIMQRFGFAKPELPDLADQIELNEASALARTERREQRVEHRVERRELRHGKEGADGDQPDGDGAGSDPDSDTADAPNDGNHAS